MLPLAGVSQPLGACRSLDRKEVEGWFTATPDVGSLGSRNCSPFSQSTSPRVTETAKRNKPLTPGSRKMIFLQFRDTGKSLPRPSGLIALSRP